MQNSFMELQNNFEAKFDGGADIELVITQGLKTASVFSSFAELYIPVAVGAAVKMTTGSEVNQIRPTSVPIAQMPEFDWRYKVSAETIKQSNNPRDRFMPFLPF